MNEFIKVTVKNGRPVIKMKMSNKHFDEVMLKLKREQSLRHEAKPTKPRRVEKPTWRRFFKRLFLTVRYYKAFRSKAAAAAVPVLLLEDGQ